MKNQKPKLIIVLGPTASGKSDLAVEIAKKINGEIISADSRQVYRGMDVGSGKITKKEMGNIPHYLLDIASPKRQFSVAQFKKIALQAIKKIYAKNKIPILCGGTGFYIKAVTDNLNLPEIKPNLKLRKKLKKNSTEKLFAILKKLDPERSKNIDAKNPRRLIRAIEIVKETKRPVPKIKNESQFDLLEIGIKMDSDKLKKRIAMRLQKRLKNGMVEEVETLNKNGVSWKRLENFGLEYKWLARYLQNKISFDEMRVRIQKDSEHYAKRQMTWFKKDPRIHWIKNSKQAFSLVKKFIE